MTQAAPESPVTPHRPSAHVHRIEVWRREGEIDPTGVAAAAEAGQRLGPIDRVRTVRVYLVEAPLDNADVQRIADELLADRVSQSPVIGVTPAPAHGHVIEVHYKPGVMDPVAQSTRDAIAEMLPTVDVDDVQVRTGHRYDMIRPADTEPITEDALKRFAEQTLANPVIQEIHTEPLWPETFPRGHRYELRLTHVPIRELDDAGLEKLAREGHLFLSLTEMQAIQAYYRDHARREPTDIELETLAQTWSEHCVHKTLKSTVRYTPHNARSERSEERDQADDPLALFHNKPGHDINPDGSVTIHNLLKQTVAAATHKLMQEAPHNDWCVSVFVDNAGIVKFDDTDAVAIKVETHNHPSAIEPYGGAATGIGGCIRDILGTGLAARPIANTDTFCVADLQTTELPKGIIHPKRILQQVVAGVRDYGNRMGIPTVNGAVYFHDDYIGNPLVFAGCVGILPLDKCFGEAKPGDRIIALGGATGRDGIHGATFSSAELTDTHADEFSHAVQIGNAITERKMMDVILQARDHADGPLFDAITDCGAGGFSSAVGEMGEKVGAYVTLETAPLKYAGLSYTEIWISEAQERMVLAVPPEKVETLRALCEAEEVGFCDLGQFGWHADDKPDEPVLVLTYENQKVGRLAMPFLHDGIPTPVREANWSERSKVQSLKSEVGGAASATLDKRQGTLDTVLRTLLSHPNIASKHWIIRQYDHEVQGGSAVKPLVGPEQDGPSDAAVIRPKLESEKAIALSCGLAPHLSEKSTDTGLAIDGDSYWATLAAIDEAVRNNVCVGADPQHIALLDNFCWPRCEDPFQMGTLVRAAEACYDGALAYRTPFVSGKDSLSNQFTTEDGQLITIPQTMLITALGIVENVTRCRTMDAKQPGHALLIVGETTGNLGGSHYAACGFAQAGSNLTIPHVDLATAPRTAQAVATLIAEGIVASAHDCSDGGLLIAAAEMAFAGRVGLDLDLANLPTDQPLDIATACFAETPARYLLEVPSDKLDAAIKHLRKHHLPFAQIGTCADHDRLTLRTDRDGRVLDAKLDDLRHAWLKPLDW